MQQDNKMKKILLFSLLVLLSACFGGGESIPQDQFYRLSAVSYHGDRLEPIVPVIAVSALDSDVLHRERAILYSQLDKPLKLQRYHYHHWTHVPSKLIQDHLVDYLRSSGIAGQVIRYGEQANIDAEIGGQLKRFERVIGTSHTTVVVQLELFYKNRGKNPRLYQNVYAQQVAVSDNSMHATAMAFSQALQAIYADFIQDVIKQTTS